MEDNNAEKIALLRKVIQERDGDIIKAATFGKQLLEDKERLNEKLHQILAENETLKQENYSLQLDLETRVQTANTQSSELEIQNKELDNVKRKLELLQRENNSQMQQIRNLKDEQVDLEKSLETAVHDKNELMKKNALQKQQIANLEQKVERSLNTSLPQNVSEEKDIKYYKLQQNRLQEALSEIQFELKTSKEEEDRLSNLVKELEEGIQDRDKEIKAFSVERKKSREVAAELQCEIETLKLEQLDVNKRGNSVFGELDDRRKLVEKEYKLLLKKYDNTIVNFKNIQRELTNCKGQMAILLSMTSRSYQADYIEKLENNVMEKRLEIESLNIQLKKFVRFHNQKPSDLAPKGGDEYDYLRVMYEISEKKIKTLENDIVTLRMKNTIDNDELTYSQHRLHQTQKDLDDMKIENLKLDQKLRELTEKPDDPGPNKDKPSIRIEILPGYNVTPEMIENKKAELLNKKSPNEIPSRTNKSIICGLKKKVVTEEDDEILRIPEDTDEQVIEVTYVKDNSEKTKRNENMKPPYASYISSYKTNKDETNYISSNKKKKEETCTHQ